SLPWSRGVSCGLGCPSLADLALGVVDRAGAVRDRKRAGWVHRRNGVEPAVRAAQRALLDVRGPGGSQVVRGLEPTAPCEPVQLVEFAAAGARDVEIQRLCLVDPFLPTRGGGDQPRRVD